MSTTMLPMPHLGPMGRSLLDRIVGSGQRGVLRDQVADWVLARLLQLGYVEEHPLDTALLVSTPAGLQRWQLEMLREEQRAGERMRKDFIRQRIEQRGTALALVPAAKARMVPAVQSSPRAGPVVLPIPAIASPAPAVATSRSGRPKTGALTLAAGIMAATGLTVLVLSGLNPASPFRPATQAAEQTPRSAVTPAAQRTALAKAAAAPPVAQKTTAMRVAEQRPAAAPASAAHHARPPAAGGAAAASAPPPHAERQAAASPVLHTALMQTAAAVPGGTSAPAAAAARPVALHPAAAKATGAPAQAAPHAPTAAHNAALGLAAATMLADAAASTATRRTAAHRLAASATGPTPASPHQADPANTPAPHKAIAALAAAPAVAQAPPAPSVVAAHARPRHPADVAAIVLASRAPDPHQAAPAKSAAADPITAAAADPHGVAQAHAGARAAPAVAEVRHPAAAVASHAAEKPQVARTTQHPHPAARRVDRGHATAHPAVAAKAVRHAAPRKLSGNAEVDLLNAQSLAAARAGREWHPGKPATPGRTIRGLRAAGLAGDDWTSPTASP